MISRTVGHETKTVSQYSVSTMSKRQQYELVRSSLLAERSTFDDHYRDLSRYILPRRTRFLTSDRNKGEKRNQAIIDSTATFALQTLRSGMHASITSPARPWMRLTTPDPDLAEFAPVKEWLHAVTQRMLTVFLRSNLYNALPVMYGDMGLFATSAMGILEDERDLFRCYPYLIGSYALGLDNRQKVNTFVRQFMMTVRQIVREFGVIPGTRNIDWSRISTNVRNLWDRGSYEETVEVCWIVSPNEDRDNSKLGSKYLPFFSCHFETAESSEGKFLREKGFHEFPIIAPRWDVSGEDTYGTECPGMTALGDVRALQVMQKRKAQAVEKMINPPLQAPAHVRSQKVSLLPGDITWVDQMQGQEGIRTLHDTRISIAELTEDINETRYMIRRAFHEDLFLMLTQSDRRDMTAREVEEKHEEKLLQLGPVTERNNDEALDPLVDRVYAMMERAGLIPPPPDELQGVDLKVEYISLMAQAQKLVGVVGLDRFVQSVGGMAEVFPSVAYKINVSQIVDEYGDALGINPKIIVSDEDAQAAMQQAAQQQQAAATAEQFKHVAAGARDLSQSSTEGDNALVKLLEGVQR